MGRIHKPFLEAYSQSLSGKCKHDLKLATLILHVGETLPGHDYYFMQINFPKRVIIQPPKLKTTVSSYFYLFSIYFELQNKTKELGNIISNCYSGTILLETIYRRHRRRKFKYTEVEWGRGRG